MVMRIHRRDAHRSLRTVGLRAPRLTCTRPHRVARFEGVIRAAEQHKGEAPGGDKPGSNGKDSKHSKAEPSKAAASGKGLQTGADKDKDFDFGAKTDDDWGKEAEDKASPLGAPESSPAVHFCCSLSTAHLDAPRPGHLRPLLVAASIFQSYQKQPSARQHTSRR